jgi:hypothetical protein
MSQSSLAPRAEDERVFAAYHQREFCTCHGFVLCAVYKAIVRVNVLCFVVWLKAWSRMITSRIRAFL